VALKTQADNIMPLLNNYTPADWNNLRTAANQLKSAGDGVSAETVLNANNTAPGAYSVPARAFLPTTTYNPSVAVAALVATVNSGVAGMPLGPLASCITQLTGVSSRVGALGSPPSSVSLGGGGGGGPPGILNYSGV
jgi:hypothetical protein